MKLPVSFNLPGFDKVAMASNPRRVFDYAMLVLANISSVLAYVTTQYPEVAMVNGIACILWAIVSYSVGYKEGHKEGYQRGKAVGRHISAQAVK